MIEGGNTTFVAVAERIMPSVVSISTRNPSLTLPRFRIELPFRRHPPRGTTPQFPPSATSALGTGVVVDEQGHVLTSYHVIRGFSNLVVKLADGTVFENSGVRLVGSDEKTDLALLKLKTSQRLPAIRFGDSDSIQVGQWVVAVGSPFGLPGTVTVGVISAKGRSSLPNAPSYQDLIQTDAAMNPGSSGGPLVSLQGEVIGINTTLGRSVDVPGGHGIGFAIPANTARMVSEQLLRRGRVIRGFLGISVQELTPELRDALGLPSIEGLFVSEVLPNSPAAKAGVQREDIITHLNDAPVTTIGRFRQDVAALEPGTCAHLGIRRGQTELRLAVVTTAMPDGH
ncbi:MAG: trypsin-like peptidase domain-containing protein [candidate division WOR-3 bacterium]